MGKVYYRVPDFQGDERTGINTDWLDHKGKGNLQYAAEDCAEHFWPHYGFDMRWPITFMVSASKDGEEQAFEVDVQHTPVFQASKKEGGE